MGGGDGVAVTRRRRVYYFAAGAYSDAASLAAGARRPSRPRLPGPCGVHCGARTCGSAHLRRASV
jgi:hypothetical protein